MEFTGVSLFKITVLIVQTGARLFFLTASLYLYNDNTCREEYKINENLMLLMSESKDNKRIPMNVKN